MLGARPGNPLFFIILTCLAAFFSVQLSLIYAAHAEQPQEEYKRIQKDIRIHKQKLESVKKKELSVIEELRKTASELNEIESELAAQRDKVKRLNSNILALQDEIKSDSAVLQRQKTHLKGR